MVNISSFLQTTRLFATNTPSTCLPVNSNPVQCTGFHVDFYTYPYSSKEGFEDQFYRDGFKEIGQLTGSKDGVSDINFFVAPKKDEIIDIYGTPVVGSNFAMELSGWFRATQSGVYKFDISKADDGLSLQIGFDHELSVSRCGGDLWKDISRNYTFFRRNVDDDAHDIEIHLTKGVYYPVRMVYYQRWGEAEISLRYTMPDGTVRETFDEVCPVTIPCETMQSSHLSTQHSAPTALVTSRFSKSSIVSSAELAAVSNSISIAKPSSSPTRSFRSSQLSSYRSSKPTSKVILTSKVTTSISQSSNIDGSAWSQINSKSIKTSSKVRTSKTRSQPTSDINTSLDTSEIISESKGLLEKDIVMPVLPTKAYTSYKKSASSAKGLSSSIKINMAESKKNPHSYPSIAVNLSSTRAVPTVASSDDFTTIYTTKGSSLPLPTVETLISTFTDKSTSKPSLDSAKSDAEKDLVTSQNSNTILSSDPSKLVSSTSSKVITMTSKLPPALPISSSLSGNTIARTSSKISASFSWQIASSHVNKTVSPSDHLSCKDSKCSTTSISPAHSPTASPDVVTVNGSSVPSSSSQYLPSPTTSATSSTITTAATKSSGKSQTESAAHTLSSTLNETHEVSRPTGSSSATYSSHDEPISSTASAPSKAVSVEESSDRAPILFRTTSVPVTTVGMDHLDDDHRDRASRVPSPASASQWVSSGGRLTEISNGALATDVNSSCRWIILLALCLLF